VLCFRGLGRMRVVIFACLVLGMVGGTWLQGASRRLRLLYLPGMHQPTADSNVAQVSLGCCSRRCSRSFVRALLCPLFHLLCLSWRRDVYVLIDASGFAADAAVTLPRARAQ
jgi:hypothetical protein